MDHEIGYHYEDLSLVARILKGRKVLEKEIVDEGIESFARNLEKLSRLVLGITICMHGSPLSQLDIRFLRKYYDYRKFGIEAEPYFDMDFEETLYLTYTGRRWDGGSVFVRNKG